jgi:sugar phosphate isomerase/epimerase
MTEFSLTSDFLGDSGPTEKCLQLAAAGGFTHIHWCHHWCDDFLYTDVEMNELHRQLDAFGLTLADVHGSAGVDKCWHSPLEYQRLAGVALVRNRIDFAARFGADRVVMHAPSTNDPAFDARLTAMVASLQELQAYCVNSGVRIAIENMPETFYYERVLIPTLEKFPAEVVGFCYDVGHHNMTRDGEDVPAKNAARDRLADRLICTHIHDNDGVEDKHWIPFTGTADWADVTAFLRKAKLTKPLNLELSFKRSGLSDEMDFVRKAHEAIVRVKARVDQA